MEQMKYRIKVEAIEGVELSADEMPDQRILDGLECNGFGLLLNKGRTKAELVLHDINALEIAACMANEPRMQAAAKVAEILDEARKKEMPDFLKSLAQKLKEND